MTMTATASVTLDCSSLSTDDLVIDDVLTSTYMLMRDGLGRPAITWRLLAAPDSADVHGSEYLAAAKDQSSIPLKVLVQADSSSALDTAIAALEAALSQFTYPVTQVVDGVTKVWDASPANYSSDGGVFNPAMVRAFIAVYVITIPVYPIAG